MIETSTTSNPSFSRSHDIIVQHRQQLRRQHETLGAADDSSAGKSTPALRTRSESELSIEQDAGSDGHDTTRWGDRGGNGVRRHKSEGEEEAEEIEKSEGDDEDSEAGEDDTLVQEPDEDSSTEMASWSGHPSVRGSTETMRMILLTFVSIGITFTWGIEMTYCTPYLLNLGLTKSNTSLVWIAGPLSGLIVQPVVGVIADESRSRWGRRRPFILLGSVIVTTSLLILGFTREIVAFFLGPAPTSLDGPEDEDEATKGGAGHARTVTIILAVLSIYAADFAINAVMSCARSLVVDTLTIEKQQAGAAWVSRMSAIGHMMAYAAGAIDLVGLFGTALGDTQFKQLTIVASAFILFSAAVTCWAVTERVLLSAADKRSLPRGEGGGRFKVVRQIWSTLLTLPPRIQAICWAVFWSWIGWFPFLFYSTTWVGETYFRYDAPEEAGGSSEDALGDIGRIGSTSLVIYSCITLLGAWLLPMLIKSPDDDEFTHRPPQSLAPFLERFNEMKPDLLTAWFFSHLMFAGAMFLAPFATSFRFATFLVAFCGIPWTLSMWAPTTFLGVEVNKMSGGNETAAEYRRLSGGGSMTELSTLGQDQTLRLEHGPETSANSSTGELSGIYFGILNIYTTLPQLVGTLISSLVFAILEPGKSPELATDAHPSEHHGTDGPNAIAVCLFIGAISAVGSAYATRRLKRI